MPQSTSSTALTTSRHTNTARAYTRGRRVTTFTAPATAQTDPARDLVAAVYTWGRIATPIADPGPCPVAWCVDCWTGSAATLDDDTVFHHSAAATVEATSHNGIDSDLPYELENRTIRVEVERFDFTTPEAAAGSEPATAALRFGSGDVIVLGAAKAVEVVAALHKARVSALSLDARGTARVDATGAVSTVRTGNGTLQFGAVLTADGPVVFVNVSAVLTAGDVRLIARHELKWFRPDSWDLTPAAANQLAAAVDAAAALAAADRAAQAVTA